MVSAKELREAYICLSNLYGAIYSDDAFKILKRYYLNLTPKAYESDLRKRAAREYNIGYSVVETDKEGVYLIYKQTLTDEEIDEIIEEGYEKPFYVPPFEVFRKYINPSFRENQREIDRVVDYIMYKTKPRSDKFDDGFLRIVYDALLKDVTPKNMNHFLKVITEDENFGRVFNSIDELNAFMAPFNKLVNNTKIYTNRGYSPLELAAKMPRSKGPLQITLGPNIRNSLLNGEIDIEEYRQGVIDSNLPPETALPLLAELAEIERKKKGRKA